jgi:hypothetical protein
MKKIMYFYKPLNEIGYIMAIKWLNPLFKTSVEIVH